EAEEHAHALVRASLGAPQVLVEVVVNGPGAALRIRRLHGDEELRREALEQSAEDRPEILEPREAPGHQEAAEVGGILVEGETRLVAPEEAEVLVADEAEGLDLDPPFRSHRHPVLEGLGDVVLGAFAVGIDDGDGEGRTLPGKEDEASA